MACTGLYGFIKTYLNDREDTRKKHETDAIYQHDLEQRIDSIQTAFAVFWNEYQESKSQQVARVKQRDNEKRENDLVHYEFGVRLTKIETRFDDHLIYKK